MNKEEIIERAERILESLSGVDNYDKFRILIKAADKSIGLWEEVESCEKDYFKKELEELEDGL